jgi:hypothetical protein
MTGRAFVLTLPVPLRILVARDRCLLSAVRTVFLLATKSLLCKKRRAARIRRSCRPRLCSWGVSANSPLAGFDVISIGRISGDPPRAGRQLHIPGDGAM